MDKIQQALILREITIFCELLSSLIVVMQLVTLEINQKLLLIHRRELRFYFIVFPICDFWNKL